MNSIDFLKKLYTIIDMFEIGCEFVATRERIVIKGYDIDKEKENYSIERTYEVEFIYNEDNTLKDTLTPVMAEIAKDTNCRK